jgi:RHS repeat-associated protein
VARSRGWLARLAVVGVLSSLLVTGTDAAPNTGADLTPTSTVAEAPDAPPAKPRPKFEVAAAPIRALLDVKAESPVVKGFDPRFSMRVDSATTADSESYRNADGSVSRVVSASPVRFLDGQGRWRQIDPTAVDEPDGGLHGRSVPVRAGLSLDDRMPVVDLPTAAGPIVMRETDHGVVLGGSNRARGRVPDRSAAAEALLKGAVAKFGAAGDRVLSYRFLSSGVKEDVALASRAAGSSFEVAFKVPQGLRARQGNGQIDFVGTDGNVLAVYGGGLAADAVAVASKSEVAPAGTTTPVVVELVRAVGVNATVRVSVDRSWFNTADRAFPVVIDPILQQGFGSGLSDVYLNADNPDGTAPGAGPEVGIPYVSQTHLRIGNRTGAGHAITFLPFNSLAAPSGYTYSSAYLQLYGYDGSTCAATATVRPITTAWNPATVTWNTQPSLGGAPDGSQSLPQTLGAWQTFGVTSAVAAKFNAQPWYGLGVVADDNTSQCGWREFYSTDAGTNPPVLVATFTAPDGPPPPPAPGPSSLGTATSQPMLADPVNVVTGNLTDTLTDLPVTDGVFGSGWARTYNLYDPSTAAGLGRGWSTPFTATVGAVTGGVELVAPDGRRAVWTPAGASWNRPPEFPADLSVAAGNYRVSFNDGTVWDFDSQGRISVLTSPLGQTVTVSRNSGGQLTTVLSSQGPQLSFAYGTSGNSAGRIVSVAGPAGTVSYGYNTNANLATVTDTGGKTSSYGYDSSNRLTTITDPTGVIVLANTFDGQGRVATQTAAAGAATTFTYGGTDTATGWSTTEVADSVTGTAGKVTYLYDSSLRVRRVRDNLPNSSGGTGNDTSRDYATPLGDLTATISRLGGQETFTYDTANRVTCDAEPSAICPASGGGVSTGSGRYRAWHYDSQGRVDQSFVAGQGVTSYAYAGSSWLPSSTTDAAGKTTTYVITNGRVTKETDPDGVATSYSYTAGGQVASTTDGAGNTTTYAYDTAGRLRCTAQPAAVCPDTAGNGGSGRYHATTYNPMGWVLSERDADGAFTSYTYDDAGRILAVTDPAGYVTTNHYDPATGLLVSVDVPGALVNNVVTYNSWHYTYDPNGNRTCEAAPGGACPNASGQGGIAPYTLTTYGPLGRVATETDQLGHTTSYLYDPAGNELERHAPDGGITRTVYDPAGRKIQEIDPAGRITATSYDSVGRVSCVARPGGNCIAATGPIETTTYDPLGRTATFTSTSGGVTTYTYTPGGRALTVTDPATGPLSTTYDNAGRTWKTSNAINAVTTLAYNTFSELTSRTSPTGLVTAWTYDPAGRQLSETDPAGVATVRTYGPRGELLAEKKGTQGAVTYTYNPDATIATVTDPLGHATSYTYDARGNRLTRTNAASKTETWTYDAANQPLTHADQLNRTTVHTYWNDPVNGHKTQDTDPTARTLTTNLNTDGTTNTKTWQQSGSTLVYTYTYDAQGNVASVGEGTNTWNSTHNNLGQLTATTSNPATGEQTTYTTNPAGQHTATNNTQTTYDVLGRPTKVIDTTSQGGVGGLFLGVTSSYASTLTSPDGVTWTQQSTPGVVLSAAAWSPALSMFAGGGTGGRIYTSADGIAWTLRATLPGGQFWEVIWSPERMMFVAVGDGAMIATSSDGLTWTARTNGFGTSKVASVAWSPQLSLFVAAGQDGKLATSSDGVTWTQRSALATGTLTKVVWSAAAAVFVTVSLGGRIASSPDGVTWTTRTNPTVNSTWAINALVWSPERGMFLLGNTLGELATSADGITWAVRSSNGLLAANDYIYSATWASDIGLFVVTATRSGVPARILTSSDAITWTARQSNLPTNSAITNMTYRASNLGPAVVSHYQYDSDNRLVQETLLSGTRTYTYGSSGRSAGRLASYTQQLPGAVVSTSFIYDENGQISIDQTNGVTTTYGYDLAGQLASQTTGNLSRSRTYDLLGRPTKVIDTTSQGGVGGLFLGVTSSYASTLTSPDGVTWTQQSTPGVVLSAAAWSPALSMFAGGGTGGRIYTSADGIAWTLRATLPGGQFWEVIWSPERMMFVAVGDGAMIATSSDGLTWTARTNGFGTSKVASVAWSPQLSLFVAAGQDGKLATSSDGVTWTQRSALATGTLTKVVWSAAAAVFVTVSLGGRIASSPDGVTWTTRTNPTVNSTWAINALVWSPERGMFLLGNTLGELATSADGITWAVRSSNGLLAANDYIYSATWASDIGLFVVTATRSGVPARILTSSDAITWTARQSNLPTNSAITNMTRKAGVTTSSTNTSSFAYDDAGAQCWGVTGTSNAPCGSPPPGATIYSYDGAGRRASEVTSGTNQLSYGYDVAGRLASIQRVSGAVTTNQARTYDPDGLVSTMVNTGGTANSWRVAWDKALPIPQAERLTPGTGLVTVLMYGADRWAGAKTGSTLSSIGLDAYGSVVPTSANAALAASPSYDAWGTAGSAMSFDPRLGYRGELTVDGLTNLRAREYQASTSQFLSVDPLDGVDGTATLSQGYAYANNDPLNLTDPEGLQAGDSTFDTPVQSADLVPPIEVPVLPPTPIAPPGPVVAPGPGAVGVAVAAALLAYAGKTLLDLDRERNKLAQFRDQVYKGASNHYRDFPRPKPGMIVYRVHNGGIALPRAGRFPAVRAWPRGSAAQFGWSWTPIPPQVIGNGDFWNFAGLPWQNWGFRLTKGRLRSLPVGSTVRNAVPIKEVTPKYEARGGLLEWGIPNAAADVQHLDSQTLNPGYGFVTCCGFRL